MDIYNELKKQGVNVSNIVNEFLVNSVLFKGDIPSLLNDILQLNKRKEEKKGLITETKAEIEVIENKIKFIEGEINKIEKQKEKTSSTKYEKKLKMLKELVSSDDERLPVFYETWLKIMKAYNPNMDMIGLRKLIEELKEKK